MTVNELETADSLPKSEIEYDLTKKLESPNSQELSAGNLKSN